MGEVRRLVAVQRQNQEFLQQYVAVVASLGRGDCDVPPSIQAERHPTRQPAVGAAGARGQTAQASQQAKGPAAAEETAVTTVSVVTAVTTVINVSGAVVSGVSSL